MTIPKDEYGRLIDTMPIPPVHNRYKRNNCGQCGARGHDRRNCPMVYLESSNRWVRKHERVR